MDCRDGQQELLERVAVIARIPFGPFEEAVVAESEIFERLKPGELAPEYQIIVHATWDGVADNFVFTFEAKRLAPGDEFWVVKPHMPVR